MPASWDFEIYEDTPEEEASNLMEHSTQSLDLSFDDEITKAQRDDRGKENEAPEGYEPPAASRQASTTNEPASPAPTRVKKTEIIRRKIVEMDDGKRSPLSDLETDEFIPEGLTKDAHIVLDESSEKVKLDVQRLFAVSPVTLVSSDLKKEDSKASKLAITSSLSEQAEVAESVVIWEDDDDAKTDVIITVKEESVDDGASA